MRAHAPRQRADGSPRRADGPGYSGHEQGHRPRWAALMRVESPLSMMYQRHCLLVPDVVVVLDVARAVVEVVMPYLTIYITLI